MRKRPLSKGMKRINNLYSSIISIDNLTLASNNAKKGKLHQRSVQEFLKNPNHNIEQLHLLLKSNTFHTSEYSTFVIHEPKERVISRLPFYPDRIVHHAILNILEPIFVKHFVIDTYSCIKKRGIHLALNNLRKALKNTTETTYCLKLDITKFYPSINHQILKQQLQRKFKDAQLLNLLFEIIDSAPGVPIGNYLSQYFANFYLSPFDRWLKQDKRVKYYFRYADDIVILSNDKAYLHSLLSEIKNFLDVKLKLHVKENYQVFPVAARGIDFVGYKTFHTHTLIRKRIKKAFARKLKTHPNNLSIASYKGWCKHANTKNLLKKLLPNEKV